jgi:hypothetical protein
LRLSNTGTPPPPAVAFPMAAMRMLLGVSIQQGAHCTILTPIMGDF